MDERKPDRGDHDQPRARPEAPRRLREASRVGRAGPRRPERRRRLDELLLFTGQRVGDVTRMRIAAGVSLAAIASQTLSTLRRSSASAGGDHGLTYLIAVPGAAHSRAETAR
jgi:hypothetical protein